MSSKATYHDHLIERYLWLAVGVAINSLGIVLITKGELGTSPISSLPYVLSLAFPALSFGGFTFVINVLFIVGQIALLRRDFQPVQLLQLAVNVVFSLVIDLASAAFAWLVPDGLAAQVFCLLFGCGILAYGICVELAPNVIVVPGEGIVRAIAAVTGKRVGTVKNVFDLTLAGSACVLSLLTMGEIRGLGAGTVISAILVGRLVNLFNGRAPLLGHINGLARG